MSARRHTRPFAALHLQTVSLLHSRARGTAGIQTTPATNEHYSGTVSPGRLERERQHSVDGSSEAGGGGQLHRQLRELCRDSIRC
jgi:hypothetical protein